MYNKVTDRKAALTQQVNPHDRPIASSSCISNDVMQQSPTKVKDLEIGFKAPISGCPDFVCRFCPTFLRTVRPPSMEKQISKSHSRPRFYYRYEIINLRRWHRKDFKSWSKMKFLPVSLFSCRDVYVQSQEKQGTVAEERVRLYREESRGALRGYAGINVALQAQGR